MYFMLHLPRLLETTALFLSVLRCPRSGGKEMEVTQPRVRDAIRTLVAFSGGESQRTELSWMISALFWVSCGTAARKARRRKCSQNEMRPVF